MSYNINWFEDNFVAIPSGVFGNCSACCFRNLSKELFCKKLECVDENTGVCVYWDTKVPGEKRELLMGMPSKEMIEWFNGTPLCRARRFSLGIVNKALQNRKQNVK